MQERAALALNDRAGNLSGALPALLVEAHRIAATVIIGVHGRKRSGPGETFWQYRPYSFGDNVQQIDWHRSARSDRVFIRENEWEAANTLWLWVSPAVAMTFQSHLATVSKGERARLLALAVASLAVRANERVSLLGSDLAPAHSRPALLRLAQTLITAPASDTLPRAIRLPKFSTVLMFGDFLEPPERIARSLGSIAANGVAGHIVQVCDPAEETLPYQGRVQFEEMAGPLTYVAGKTESLREAYQAKFAEQRARVRDITRRIGWSFAVHRTDEAPLRILHALHGLIGGEKSRANQARAF
ncbi:DUF58 domain-containing protein [Taklimakanibacter lacteus]|uniref:DUF58 domain-containing protein n=1 Tax=Taklimakanibacter lacteus TaxID=2268456 RepID=UPI000E670372